jgi:hypothetical protein
VSPDTLDRALRVLDVLIKESERRGCTWKVTEQGTTTIECDGEEMKVEMKERLSRREIPPPPPPPETRRRRGPAWESSYTPTYYPRYEWVSTGQLSFHIDQYGGAGVRRDWSDGKRLRLENKLHEILVGLQNMAAGIRAERQKWDDWKHEQELAEERRLTRVRAAEVQRRLRLRMVRAMQRWEHARRLQLFCNAVERRLASLTTGQTQRVQKWLAWARQQADLLDPLQTDLRALSSMSVTLPHWFKGMGQYDNPEPDWWTPLAVEEADSSDEPD